GPGGVTAIVDCSCAALIPMPLPLPKPCFPGPSLGPIPRPYLTGPTEKTPREGEAAPPWVRLLYQLIRATSWIVRRVSVPTRFVTWNPVRVLPPIPVVRLPLTLASGRKFGWLNAFRNSAANSMFERPTRSVRLEIRMSCALNIGPVTTSAPVPQSPTPVVTAVVARTMQSGPFAGANKRPAGDAPE